MNVLKRMNQSEIILSNQKVVNVPRSKSPLIFLAFVVALVIAGYITAFDLNLLIERGDEFFTILFDMFPPDFTMFESIITPLVETIKMSFLGSILGCFFAFPIAILSSSNINKSTVVLHVVRLMLSIIRTIPTLVLALFSTFIFGLGTFSGTVAITIFTFGIVAKMLYEKIETVDMGPFEAMEALGATKLESFNASITPQILPTYFSICLYTLEINVRAAAILGYVGAGGIGLLLKEKIGWREYDRVGMIIFMLFITVVMIENLSRYIRERLV